MVLTRDWKNTLVKSDGTIEDAVRSLDSSKLKIVLVVDEQNILLGTITDGDIRRGLLKGCRLDNLVHSIMKSSPSVVQCSMPIHLIQEKMAIEKILQIPLVNEEGRVQGLFVRNEDALNVLKRPNSMVIMAGGFGRRLMPHTENCPKPMLAVNGKPILEHILIKAKQEGFLHFYISVHYLSHIIEEYFGDGESFGVKIQYLRESSPLGTAGALGLIDGGIQADLVITNGDILADISYGRIVDFHSEHKSDATMAIRTYELTSPYGVVKSNDMRIIDIEEKPTFRLDINAGVYVLSPRVFKFIKKNHAVDMPTFFQEMIQESMKVLAYPLHEEWMDIGRSDDLIAANKKFELDDN